MNILEKIIEHKHAEIQERSLITPLERIQKSQRLYSVRNFNNALKNEGIQIIAEIKRRSPSDGDINMHADPCKIAEAYAKNGAACISVLTDQHYFGGQLEFIQQVKATIKLPVLRKDFIISEYQVWESFHAGADAILLIADAVESSVIKDLYQLASELGLNPKLAKRAGLLHDIGKVWPDEPEKPHAIIGMELAQKYKENAEVCNAIGAHHDEIEMTTLLSPIVQVCDAISGARPGARRQVLDSYIQRLKDLEDIAFGFNGVQKAYAIQAGRELRVIVESEKVNDDKAAELSFEISQKIQTDMTYPGQVKVTVIRETRSVNVAK